MAKKNFLLLSLEDDKINKISNVISNKSCKKILDYLSEHEATETEISEKLNIPLSTVHYNLQQLVDAGLIVAEEFHYSKKGKEVNHYKLANKYIIIAPKKTTGITSKLRGILPVALIVGGATLILQYMQRFFAKGGTTRIFTDTKQTIIKETFVQKAAESADMITAPVPEVMQAAQEEAVAASGLAEKVVNGTLETINQTEHILEPETVVKTITAEPSIFANIALWFLIGAVFALAIYFIINKYKKDFD